MNDHYQTIVDRDTVQTHLEAADWRIFDCRFNLAKPKWGREVYSEAHIPGALYADLDNDLAGPVTAATGRHPLPAPEVFLDTMRRWGLRESDQIVVYDDSGGAIAARLWWMLRHMGHQAVALMEGGIERWREEGRSLSAAAPQVTPSNYSAKPLQDDMVDVDEVAAELGKVEQVVIDARAAQRFSGEIEPLDTVGGHLPGALNRPFSSNLDSSGDFLSAAELRSQFLTLIGDVRPGAIVHSCGSGVTACHNLLAMEHAGLHGSRLYPGSWSEWIRDPARPVATGS